MTTTAPALEVVEHTLAEYERIAIGTGAWNGAEAPEFSNDGVTWSAAWLPSEDFPYPLLARATAYRHGIDRPTVVVVRWDECVPAVDDWRDLWLRKPTALFGAFARRAAIRSAFRDVLGDRREPDEVEPPKPAEAVEARDWLAMIEDAQTLEELLHLHKTARLGRAVTVELERAIRLRQRALMTPSVTSIKDSVEAMANDLPTLAAGGTGASRIKINLAAQTPTTEETEETAIAIEPRPVPRPPKVRLEDTVRKPQPRKRGK